jgi:hypothetical protein
MYFEQFMNGSAEMEPVSHVDILAMACEGAEFAGDAEIALIEEDGRICMTLGSEGVGDALAAVADKAKEVGTKIWKWLVEFMRKVRAFVSQAIVSLRNGAIMNTLKKIIAKGKAKMKNDEWKENAPKPERASKWNVDVQRAVNGIWFIGEPAVKKLYDTAGKLNTKLTKAMGNSASFGTGKDQDGTGAYKDMTSGASDSDSEIQSILDEIPKIKDENDGEPFKKSTPGGYVGSVGSAGKKNANTQWLERLDAAFVKEIKVDSNETNAKIITSAINAAIMLSKKMAADPIIKSYEVLKLLDTEVNLVKKLCADAGKAGARELKRIKKIQKCVSKIGTTVTLFCRRQLGAYKKATALVLRLYSMAGSMEKDDYNED